MELHHRPEIESNKWRSIRVFQCVRVTFPQGRLMLMIATVTASEFSVFES